MVNTEVLILQFNLRRIRSMHSVTHETDIFTSLTKPSGPSTFQVGEGTLLLLTQLSTLFFLHAACCKLRFDPLLLWLSLLSPSVLSLVVLASILLVFLLRTLRLSLFQLSLLPLPHSRELSPFTGLSIRWADSPRGREPAPVSFGRPESKNAAGPGGGFHFLTSGQRPFNPRSFT